MCILLQSYGQYLCEDCKLLHSRVKTTKTYEVVGLETLITPGSEAMETPTCKDHNRPIMHFCKSHMAVLCKFYKLVDHYNCEIQNITEFDNAIHCIFTGEEGKRIHKCLEELIDHFNKCMDKTQSYKNNLLKRLQSANDNVKQASMTINNHLDKIEAEAHREIDKVFDAEMKHLEDQRHVCDVTICKLPERLSKLERATGLVIRNPNS